MEIEIEIQPLLVEITRSERAIQEGIAQLRSSKNATSTKIQEESKTLDTQIEQLVDKVKKAKIIAKSNVNHKDLLNKIRRHKEEAQSLKELLRSARLSWRANQAEQHERERQDLLGADKTNSGVRRRPAPRIRTEDDALRASEHATESLRRVREMMVTEVQHGAEINEELESQGKVIEAATSEHERINSTIGTGRGLIARLKRRDFTDKLLVTLAFIVFCLVCAYIIRARLRILPFGLFSSWF